MAPAPSSDTPTAADIRRAVRHLPPDQRTAIAMRELQGRTNAEIADAVGLTAAATERLLFRARRSLREQLSETLTCLEAEVAINRRLDGESSRHENAALRLHIRDCPKCAALARTYRAQRGLLGKLGTAAFPTSLLPVGGLGAKVAMIAAAAAVSGGGYVVARDVAPAVAVPQAPAKPAAAAVSAPHRMRPVTTKTVPVNHRVVRRPRSRPTAPRATRFLPNATPASPAADPPIAFHEPTLAPPAVVNGDAGGEATPVSPAGAPIDGPPAPPAAPPTIAPPEQPRTAAPDEPPAAGPATAADPSPPAGPAQGLVPADPGVEAEDHRVTPDPPDVAAGPAVDRITIERNSHF